MVQRQFRNLSTLVFQQARQHFRFIIVQFIYSSIRQIYNSYQISNEISSYEFQDQPKINCIRNQMNIHNPYKVETPMEKNCIGKSAMSYVLGGAMGLIMAMFMNAVQMRQIQIGKIRRSTAIVVKKDWRRIMGTAKGFASFGGFFVLYECMIQHIRVKDDGINSFLAGMATSMILGANVMSTKQLFYSGLGGGVMCWGFYKVFKMLGY